MAVRGIVRWLLWRLTGIESTLTTPASRTFEVAGESRTFEVASESRTLEVT